MKYLITGVTGAGKSTIGEKLIEFGFRYIELDTNKISHWFHKETGERGEYSPGASKEWLDQYSWIADKTKLSQILVEEPEKDVFACGVVSNTIDILDLFDKVFLLQISPETIRKRLAERTTEGAFGKSEDEVNDVLSWQKSFDNELICLGAIPINSEKSIDSVVAEILTKI